MQTFRINSKNKKRHFIYTNL